MKEIIVYTSNFCGYCGAAKQWLQNNELDCSIFRYKILKSQFYKNSMGEGEMIGDYTPPNEWKYPRPDSIGELIHNKVCEEHQ